MKPKKSEPKINAADSTPADVIRRKLAEHAALCGENAELEELYAALKRDEALLVNGASFDLNDAEQFALLSQLRLKLDIIPNRVRRVAEQSAATEAEIGVECAAAIQHLRSLLGSRQEVEHARVFADLAGRFEPDAHQLLKDWILDTVPLRALSKISDLISSSRLSGREPLFHAAAVLEAFDAVAALPPIQAS
jgi:hypothetical protein